MLYWYKVQLNEVKFATIFISAIKLNILVLFFYLDLDRPAASTLNLGILKPRR